MAGGGRAALMRDAAKRLGATVEETPRSIWLAKNGVTVTASIHDVAELGPRLELRAIPLPPGLPRFRVYPEGFKSFASKVVGVKEIEIGLAAFDVQYMIKGEDEELVRQALTSERCMAMLDGFREAELLCKGDVVTLTRQGLFSEVTISDDLIDRGFTFLFDLGSADLYGNALLRDLPDATFRSAALPYVDIEGPGEIRVGFGRRRKRLFTQARALVPNLGELPKRAVDRAGALGATVDHKDDQVIMAWPAIVRDPAPLVESIELLRSLLTGPREGVFR